MLPVRRTDSVIRDFLNHSGFHSFLSVLAMFYVVRGSSQSYLSSSEGWVVASEGLIYFLKCGHVLKLRPNNSSTFSGWYKNCRLASVSENLPARTHISFPLFYCWHNSLSSFTIYIIIQKKTPETSNKCYTVVNVNISTVIFKLSQGFSMCFYIAGICYTRFFFCLSCIRTTWENFHRWTQ